MKKYLILIFGVLFLIIFMAMSTRAQEQFVWTGGGVDFYDAEEATFDIGWGVSVGEDKAAVTTIKMTDKRATISEDFMQIVTKQGPVTLFTLGGIGFTSGEGKTDFTFGGGPGIAFDLKGLSSKLKNCSIMGMIKVTNAPEDGGVLPRFIGGFVYKFGGK